MKRARHASPLRTAGAIYFRVRAIAARVVLDLVLVRRDEAVATPAGLLFRPFVLAAGRAGRDFFTAADVLVDRFALARAFVRDGLAVATLAASAAAVAVERGSELDGRGVATDGVWTGCFLLTVRVARSGSRSLNNVAAAAPIMSPPSATTTAGFSSTLRMLSSLLRLRSGWVDAGRVFRVNRWGLGSGPSQSG